MKTAAIITCAGRGTRAGLGYNKIFYPIGPLPLIAKTALPFLGCERMDSLIFTASEADFNRLRGIVEGFSTEKRCSVVMGGDSRFQSVMRALDSVADDVEWVVIHDGARPFLDPADLQSVLTAAQTHGAAILCAPLTDTIKRIEDGKAVETPSRTDYVLAQTPQVFRLKSLREAYRKAEHDGFIYTDDASVYERYIGPVALVWASRRNDKITVPSDLEDLLCPAGYLIGTGFDTHRLVYDRKLILGGVEIPHSKGLLGHSDADVLTHAVMDSLLCPFNLDIGHLFPDHDMRYKDISSLVLLKEVSAFLEGKGYQVHNISASIIAQQPKLGAYLPAMANSLAKMLKIDAGKIGLGATTTEGLGLIGREEGMSVHAVSSLIKTSSMKTF